jgi:SAM-dependent methyltransferase
VKSYVATSLGLQGRINEARNLYLRHTRDVAQKVHDLLEQADDSCTKISSLLGVPVTGLNILEVGPGQQLVELAYFGRQNEVVGIDVDLIMRRISLRGCLGMVKQNGWMRTGKTLARKVVRIDSKIRPELVRQLGLLTMPELRVLQMDAEKMTFPSSQFDVVYSNAVFEHLSDPPAVISEIRRVLKPGGVMLTRFHLYTSESGCHDTRIFAGQRDGLPFWAHLRPEHEQEVKSNTYINKLRLDDWKRIFHSAMPGAEVLPLCDAGDIDREQLRKLRSEGHLEAYSDEELLSITVDVTWRKPSHDAVYVR